MLQIHNKLASLDRRLLFWGDIAMNAPEQVKRLPKDMVAIAWIYSPSAEGYSAWLKPYTDAGMETWVAPGVSNWKRVYPDNDSALRNIQGLVRDGQAAHSTGMLNTVWNDDGEGLFQENWYGVLFGAAAAWQPGTSDLTQFEDSYGQALHRDGTGKINDAQRELIAIYQMLQQAKVQELSDELFWMDPWTTEGQAAASELRPLLAALRLHAERALTLLAQARTVGRLEETDALDALELGARRLDFIGQKFEPRMTLPLCTNRPTRGREIRKTQSASTDCFTTSPAPTGCVKTCVTGTATSVSDIPNSGCVRIGPIGCRTFWFVMIWRPNCGYCAVTNM